MSFLFDTAEYLGPMNLDESEDTEVGERNVQIRIQRKTEEPEEESVETDSQITPISELVLTVNTTSHPAWGRNPLFQAEKKSKFTKMLPVHEHKRK